MHFQGSNFLPPSVDGISFQNLNIKAHEYQCKFSYSLLDSWNFLQLVFAFYTMVICTFVILHPYATENIFPGGK